ncbi:MAG: glycosyltransferase [Bacteroidota bacterium]|nr:glycosyltransferase [Bacteroidota bacterium]
MQTIGIIIPCYNEAKRLDTNYLISFLKDNQHIKVLLVNDGSTDNTIEIIEKIAAELPLQIDVLNCIQNGGKAEAVRLGMLHLSQHNELEWVGYFDADFSTQLEEINYFFEFIPKDKTFDMMIGSRINRLGSKIVRNEFRHYLSRIIGTLTSRILKLPVYDTQCGAKIINKKHIDLLFNKPFVSSWMFDVELFARFINFYGHEKCLQQIIEVPLRQWIEKGDSKISWSYTFKLPLELLKIRKTYF